MKCAAFFDVDGTLVSCQTQQQFARILRLEGLLTGRQVLRIFVGDDDIALIDEANAKGGKDNTTVVLVEVGG